LGERQESGVSFTRVGYTNGDDAKKENEPRKLLAYRRLRAEWQIGHDRGVTAKGLAHLRNDWRLSRGARVVWLKIKAGLGAHLLLRRTRRIGVYFARNGLARFRCFIGVELFIRSATAKGNNSTSEENETPAFHGEINSRRVLDFQRR
jgi:hypothetical protein